MSVPVFRDRMSDGFRQVGCVHVMRSDIPNRVQSSTTIPLVSLTNAALIWFTFGHVWFKCVSVCVYLWCSWKTALCFKVFIGKKYCWSWSWYFSSTAQHSFFCWGLIIFWCVYLLSPPITYKTQLLFWSLVLSPAFFSHRMTRKSDLICGFPLLVLWLSNLHSIAPKHTHCTA